MSRLHLRPAKADRNFRTLHVTPESAGWQYVGFDLCRVPAGETVRGETGDREACLVFVSGSGEAKAGGIGFSTLGERADPFSGKPHSLYVPAGSDWSVKARSELELAVCSAPGVKGARPPRVIGEDSHPVMTRGKGSNVRYVTDIINETDPADSLLVVEVITPAGHASSYPPHKHDRDAFPEETLLEEVYYHRLNPPQGFGFQRVYTDDRSL
ncbi:MAG: 5-deoxy-glucuronate isomerase, partial [Rhizobiales bacterium]|nr:5-deoxy-glucuronate isomerase [Hyphomicrobiales bacterium]